MSSSRIPSLCSSRPCGETVVDSPAVRVRGLRKVIGERVVLRDIEFDVSPGTIVALLGANGAGKSTLLKILAGLTAPTLGEVEICGLSLATHARQLRSRIGYIGHNSMLYRDLSARENLIFFGKMHGLQDAAGRADQLLEQFQLAGRAHDPVQSFSRGMTQRVAIARALLCDPDLLLADEPFTGLDAPSRRILEAILISLNDQGKTILLTNHDVEQSASLAQRVLILNHGRLVLDESHEDFAGSRLELESFHMEIARA